MDLVSERQVVKLAKWQNLFRELLRWQQRHSSICGNMCKLLGHSDHFPVFLQNWKHKYNPLVYIYTSRVMMMWSNSPFHGNRAIITNGMAAQHITKQVKVTVQETDALENRMCKTSSFAKWLIHLNHYLYFDLVMFIQRSLHSIKELLFIDQTVWSFLHRHV